MSSVRPRRLIGVLDFRLPCGRARSAACRPSHLSGPRGRHPGRGEGKAVRAGGRGGGWRCFRRAVWHGWDEGDATASYLLVSIAKEFADDVFAGTARHRPAVLPPSIGFRDGTAELALQRIALELKQPDPISATMVECQATQLLGQMLRLNGVHQEPAKGGLSSFDLKRAVDMIETLSDGRPTLADLAKEIGVSRFHFWRAFKQSTGMTPHAFIAQRRLEQSADMLRSTNLSATEIAMECGFGSSSHFATAFKRAFGAGPTEFRRKWRI